MNDGVSDIGQEAVLSDIRQSAGRSDIGQLILTLVELAATGLTLYIALRVIAGPDAVRTMQMRAAKHCERFCMTQAQMWARLADIASHAYERNRAHVA